MTTNERKEAVVEWFKTAKAGDEVCLTNTYDVTRSMATLFGTLIPNNLHNEESDDICTITTIRAILSDGAVVVGDKIFNADGTLPESTPMSGHPSLHPVTDELRQLAWRYNFYKSVKSVQWESFSDDTLNTVIDIINKEINDIKDRQEKEQQKKEEREIADKKAKEEEISNSGLITSTDNTSDISLRGCLTATNHFEPVVSHTRCADCPNRKENDNDNGNES